MPGRPKGRAARLKAGLIDGIQRKAPTRTRVYRQRVVAETLGVCRWTLGRRWKRVRWTTGAVALAAAALLRREARRWGK